MTKVTQDNEPLTFQALGLAAALVVNRMRNAQSLRELQLDEQKQEPSRDDCDRTDTKKEKSKPDRDYVETRLRELRAWERRVKGLGK